jgi:hypothetical protein
MLTTLSPTGRLRLPASKAYAAALATSLAVFERYREVAT